MSLRAFGRLPKRMQNDTTRMYYDRLAGKRVQLAIKRGMDILLSLGLLVLTFPLMVFCALWVQSDGGSILFRQIRIGRYGMPFVIYKFRTMEERAYLGGELTHAQDSRITKAGKLLRRTRMDELPQLFNVLKGEMSLVGPRPEVPRYAALYTDRMQATLLLPVGITCRASLHFKDEALLMNEENGEQVYRQRILPAKMEENIRYLRDFSLWEDGKILLETIRMAAKEVFGWSLWI